jgi:hypothetical protein
MMPAGTTELVPRVIGINHCFGVRVVPTGEVMVVDRVAGRVLRVPPPDVMPGMLMAEDLPLSVGGPPLPHPTSLQVGPDGRLYVAAHGVYGTTDPDGMIFAWHDGDEMPSVYRAGLTDPMGCSWSSDGNLYITERDWTAARPGIVVRYEPAGDRITPIATGFLSPMGIDMTPAGSVFLADPDSDATFILLHQPLPRLPMTIDPKKYVIEPLGKGPLRTLTCRVSFTMSPRQTIRWANITQVNGQYLPNHVPASSITETADGITAVFPGLPVEPYLANGTQTIRVQMGMTTGFQFYGENTVDVVRPR